VFSSKFFSRKEFDLNFLNKCNMSFDSWRKVIFLYNLEQRMICAAYCTTREKNSRHVQRLLRINSASSTFQQQYTDWSSLYDNSSFIYIYRSYLFWTHFHLFIPWYWHHKVSETLGHYIISFNMLILDLLLLFFLICMW